MLSSSQEEFINQTKNRKNKKTSTLLNVRNINNQSSESLTRIRDSSEDKMDYSLNAYTNQNIPTKFKYKDSKQYPTELQNSLTTNLR